MVLTNNQSASVECGWGLWGVGVDEEEQLCLNGTFRIAGLNSSGALVVQRFRVWSLQSGSRALQV